MLSPRILLIIGSIITLLLFLQTNGNSEIPESVPEVFDVKDRKMQADLMGKSRKNDSVSTLRGELQQLKAEMNRLKLLVKNSHNNLAMLIENQQTGELQETESHSSEEFMQDIVEQGAIQEEQLASMEASLAEETVDAEWSNATSDQVQAAFDSAELDGAEIVDLDCRKTLCRIEMNIDDPLFAAEYQLWLSVKIGDILPQASMKISQDEQGNSSAVLFLAREGYNLPAIDN